MYCTHCNDLGLTNTFSCGSDMKYTSLLNHLCQVNVSVWISVFKSNDVFECSFIASMLEQKPTGYICILESSSQQTDNYVPPHCPILIGLFVSESWHLSEYPYSGQQASSSRLFVRKRLSVGRGWILDKRCSHEGQRSSDGWVGHTFCSSATLRYTEYSQNRERSNFLIFSWDVPMTTQHGANHQICWRTPA